MFSGFNGVNMKEYKELLYLLLALFVLLVGWCVWTMRPYQNGERAAYVETLLRPKSSFPLNLKWQVDLGRSTYDYPVYRDGLVLMPADGYINSNWYGLEAETGRVIWEQWTGSNNFLRCLTTKYLVVSGYSSFKTLNMHTGVLVWEKEGANTASCSEKVVFYSEVPRNSVSAADLTTGQNFWVGTKPRKSFSGVIYNPEEKELLATHAEEFYIVEPQTGRLKSSFPKVGFAPQGGPPWIRGSMYLIDRGELFVGANVQDTQTGRVIHRENRFGVNRLPTVTADIVYLAALHDGVVALDRATYEIQWIYSPPTSQPDSASLATISAVAILNNIGYAIFSDATLRAFDLETGLELGYWQPDQEDLMDWPVCIYPDPLSDCIESARAGLATSAETLFVSFGDGKLYAFEP